MGKNMEAVGVGALNIDRHYVVERILEDGESEVKKVFSAPGGSAANTIYGLARLGIKTGFCGVVGDDKEGELIIEHFRRVGVDTEQIRVKPGISTGSVICLSDDLGHRSLYVVPGANSLPGAAFLDEAYINNTRLIHFSSFAGDEQLGFLISLTKRVRPETKLSFAPGALYATKGLEILAPIIGRSEVLFLNREEIIKLTGKDIKSGAAACLEMGCHIVVVTLGSGIMIDIGYGASQRTITASCYLKSFEEEHYIEPVRTTSPCLGSTGAGDAFAAGFLYGLLKGKSLRECGKLGTVVALSSISRLGAREGLPTSDELDNKYHLIFP